MGDDSIVFPVKLANMKYAKNKNSCHKRSSVGIVASQIK
jgi:hypothetical protein